MRMINPFNGEGLVQDFRFAARMLGKNPGFTAVALCTLALGIGSCTAIFNLVEAVLIRPLPVAHPERLVWIENTASGGLSSHTFNVATLLEWRRQSESFEKLAAYFAFFDYVRYTLTGTGEPQRLRGVGISQNFLDALGVRPMLGRNFVDEECVWNGRKAVILSHAFWREHFAGDRNIVGRSLILNGESTEIVGVLPSSFDFASVFSPGTGVELLLPFPMSNETAQWGHTIFGVGLLKPSVSVAQAQAELDVINDRLRAARQLGVGSGARVIGLEDNIRGGFRAAFRMLFGAVFCVLLIACVNLSNLLLARGNARGGEFAIRNALGAGRWRLVRQAMAESLLLALSGCALAVPLALVGTAALARVRAFSIPLLQTSTFDATTCGFMLVVTFLVGMLCGLLPAWQLSYGAARKILPLAGRLGTAGKSGVRIRQCLVVAEIGLACLLLVGAGLFIRSFTAVLNVNVGFQAKHALAWRADSTRQFNSTTTAARYFDMLLDRVAALPGVQSVGLTDTLPLGRNREFIVGAKGESYLPGQYPTAFPRIVDQNYLQTMAIPLRAGRYFDSHDTSSSEKVVIINETLARHLWSGQNAVGRVFVANWGVGDCRVAGVVGDVRHSGLEEKPGSEFYLDFHQAADWGGGAVELVVRASRPLESMVPAVRAAMKEFDPTLPSGEFITLDEIVDHAVAPRRLITELLSSFSAFALLLASIGLYGLVSYSVGQRTREIGIRLAIGAQRGDVFRMVAAEGLKLAVIGLVLGLIGALLTTGMLRNLLFGVSSWDPFIFPIAAVILLGVTLLACLIPARLANKVDPMIALRYE
jgi:putative ABC transport system permease protein